MWRDYNVTKVKVKPFRIKQRDILYRYIFKIVISEQIFNVLMERISITTLTL